MGIHVCSNSLFSVLQVVLDLGRRPEARFLGGRGGEYLREAEVCTLPQFWALLKCSTYDVYARSWGFYGSVAALL